MYLLLVTPPLLQLNAPYPATAVLQKMLRAHGYDVAQRDMSLDFALKIFTPEIIRQAAAEAAKMKNPSGPMAFFLDSADDYARTVMDVVAFLQGRHPELAWRISSRTFLPEGPFFSQLSEAEGEEDEENLQVYFGQMGVQDRAKYLASLYMDDLSSYLNEALDVNFMFGKYGESLAMSLPSFEPLRRHLIRNTSTIMETLLDNMTEELLSEGHPRFIGFAIPFPGTLYGAFRMARKIREKSPETKIIFGGGYVNSELRNLEDKRIFDYVDYISFDEGLQPLLAILKDELAPSGDADGCPQLGHRRVLTKDGWQSLPHCSPSPPMLVPDYDGLDLSKYLSIVEMLNPLHRIWTDGVWLKMQLAQGCYWHKCAFCDLALDYIGRYEPGKATEIVDAMEELMEKTGRRGFHFVDEAVAPTLLKAVSEEILRRSLSPVWWGNIRFDRNFTPELAELMSSAGCIAVTGGLECANDRLLKLMNKGITLATARAAFEAFSSASIMVHAYLMYGFPTETKDEAIGALEFVRQCFADGILQSAFWHRFALTAHSGIAREPDKFGIVIEKTEINGPRFALNEITYHEEKAPDWDAIGKILKTALYNYMQGRGLDMPARQWFKRR
ncbi:MAG: radical SAM protein [Victivallales bacterium]|nr:radical SAM protein [Victivallales bacterium]